MTSYYFLKLFYALLLLLLHDAGSILGFNNSAAIKCIHTERQALLNFKHSVRDSSGMLSTWRDDDNSRDCCEWKGIQCNNETGHVLMLRLRGQEIESLDGIFNITSLIALQNIQHLDLSNNFFWFGHIPQLMGSFTNLRYLNLSNSNLGGSIPCELGNLTHLQYLDLGHNDLEGVLPYQLGNLTQLRYLDLSGNSFSGALPFQVGNLSLLHTLGLGGNLDVKPKDAEWLIGLYSLTNLRLSSLQNLAHSHHWLQAINKLFQNLTELRLVDCSLSDTDIQSLFYSHSKFSPSSLTVLVDGSFLMSSTSIMNSSSSLVSLDLSSNLLKSSTIFYWLFNFTTNLRTLSLFDNMLEGPIPDGFGKVMNSLEYLDLSRNKLQGELPSFFGNICTLQMLDLSNNNLSGDISSFFQNSSWCNRHILKSLYLSDNHITGMLPKGIGLLTELQSLSLEGNSLEGDVTDSHLSSFTKLKFLYLSENSLSLKIVPSWVPPFQLRSLGLRSCRLGPTFPSWLQTQSSLYQLDISNSGLNDSVPDWFWNNLKYMLMLNMSQNNLFGAIPNISPKLMHTPSILLNSNQFEGKVPSFLLQASELILSNNKFSDLFSFLCDPIIVPNLFTLDLSSNQIKGEVPDCWKSVETLLFLDLSNNNLSGKIPKSMGSLVKLEALVLGNNTLVGELPSTLKNCNNLIMLDLGENMLSGPIPSWIGEYMQKLIILSLRENHFSGILPVQLCYLKHIQLLDLSMNNLSKRIPTCLQNMTAMSQKSINTTEILDNLYLNINFYFTDRAFGFGNYKLVISWMWKDVKRGLEDPELEFKSIDLSSNNLTGEIPKEDGYLVGLVSLNLSRNNLSGEIPSQIGNLTSLEFLDLSRNHFTGRIPSSISEIDSLGRIDLSYNSLSGRIPSGRHFETFEAPSFEGNVDLCGEQLNKSCPGDGDQTTTRPQEATIHDGDDSIFYEGLYMSLGIGYFIGFWGLLGPLLLWRPWRIAYIRFLNRLTGYVL